MHPKPSYFKPHREIVVAIFMFLFTLVSRTALNRLKNKTVDMQIIILSKQ